MIYTIDERGIHYIIDEPQPIPDSETVRSVEVIAAKLREELAQCECRAQHAPTLCGSCDVDNWG
jgi:hypothetical protein